MNKKSFLYVLKVVGLFLIISFAIDKLVFYALNTVSDKVLTGQSIGKLNQYLAAKDDLDFIIYGSSRANHNIDPGVLGENGYNIGMDGSKLAYASTLIKTLPKQKKQLVLLHIDPENYFSTTYTGDDIKVLKTKYNRNQVITNEIDQLKQNNSLQKFYWSLNYNGKLLGIIKNYVKPNYDHKKYLGYDPIYVSENQKEIFKKLREQNEVTECETDFKSNEIYSRLLDELVLFCEENNKELFVFTSPVLNDTCKEDNIKLSSIMNNKGVNYLDFSDVMNSNQSFDNWKDRTHLSNLGAERFTEIIKRNAAL